MKFRNLFGAKRAKATVPHTAAQELLRRAITLHDDGLLADASSTYQAVLALERQNWDASIAVASIALQTGDLEAAVQLYSALVESRPDFAEGYYKRANAYNRLGRWPAALFDYDRATSLDPKYASAFCNRGTVLERLERWDEALASYDRALDLNPTDALAHYNRAGTLRQLGRSEEAIRGYDQAIALNGAYLEAYVNRGHLLHKLLRHEAAAESYRQALELGSMPAPDLRGGAPSGLRPELRYLLGLKRHVQMQICDWDGMNTDLQHIADALRAGLLVTQPLPALTMFDEPALHRVAAETWIREEAPADASLGVISPRPKTAKIRLGYFSSDFRSHPVANVVAGLFEHHDRARFAVTAFAYGPESNDQMTARLSKAFDDFVDVRRLSDFEVAKMARSMGIDIAVNLNGITEHCRSRVFALRAAPIQINYLGYPGTMGTEYMDYMIADGVVIPRVLQRWYVERIIYLPGSFMPFDSRSAIAGRLFKREELDLPPAGFVFCCFNTCSKFTPEVFDCWMRVLKRTENSVLWLAPTNPAAAANLRKEASRRGIDARRLIFAHRIESFPEHLARLRAADIFLDTFPYNAHSTSLDALFAGLPILTYAGKSFASRVAASLLLAINMPELIAASLAEYEDTAVALACDPARFREMRKMLAAKRLESPIFDTARYARDLEAAYEVVYDRHHAGERPAHVNEHLLI